MTRRRALLAGAVAAMFVPVPALAAMATAPSPAKWSWIVFERATYVSALPGPLDMLFSTSAVRDHPGWYVDASGKTVGIQTRIRLLVTGPPATQKIAVAGTFTCSDDETTVTHDYRYTVRPGKSLLLPRSLLQDPPYDRLRPPKVACSWSFEIVSPRIGYGAQKATVEALAFAPKYVLAGGQGMYDKQDCTITVTRSSERRRTCHALT